MLYGINFLFALVVVLPLNGLFDDTVGNSLMLDRSLTKFDFVFISEFLNQFGDRLQDWMKSASLGLFLYFVFSIFLMGGILNMLKANLTAFHQATFWSGTARYFWRLLRLSLYFLLVQALLLFAFLRIFSACGLNPLCIESDADLVLRFRWMSFIYVFAAISVFMLQDYSKIHLVHQEGSSLFKSFWSAIRLVFRNFKSCLPLYLLNLAVALLLTLLYWWLSGLPNKGSMSGIAWVYQMSQ